MQVFSIVNYSQPEQALIYICHLLNRQKLLDALNEARRAKPESDFLLIEVPEWEAKEATLRSLTEFHPTGSLRMSIPYRNCCAYSFSNGRCIFFDHIAINFSHSFEWLFIFLTINTFHVMHFDVL